MAVITHTQYVVLLAYGRGAQITDIAQQVGWTQVQVGRLLGAAGALTRLRARELARVARRVDEAPTVTEDPRSTCPSTGTHDSEHAYKRAGCRCPAAIVAYGRRKQRERTRERAQRLATRELAAVA